MTTQRTYLLLAALLMAALAAPAGGTPAVAPALDADSGAIPAPNADGPSPDSDSAPVADTPPAPDSATAPIAAAPVPLETPLTQDVLLASLTREIASRFNLDGDLELEVFNAWTPPDRVANKWRLSVIEYPAVAGQSMLIRFRVFADGNPVQDSTLMFRACLWRDAWFATQPIESGAAFDPASLETRRIDCFRARDALPAGVAANGYIYARSVQPGGMLTWEDIRLRPLVRKGEMVDVCAIDGALRVTMKAMALESGSRGDIVNVRNPETMKTIPTQVVDENRVEVHF